MMRYAVVTCILSVLLHRATSSKLGGAEALGSKLTEVAEQALGMEALTKDMKSKADVIVSVPDGNAIVDKLAETHGETLQTYNKALIKLWNKVKMHLDDNDKNVEYEECCKVNPDTLSYDSTFRKSVNKEAMCYRLAENVNRTMVDYAPIHLTETMRQNLAMIQNLGWQYYGTEQGVMQIYPSRDKSSCIDYDPRHRPWYAEANVPKAKDIVMVFDLNTADNKQLMLDAMGIILNTTNPNDRLAMVAVGNPEPQTPPNGCQSTQLAFATEHNKDVFYNFPKSLIGFGKGSNHKLAFDRAFRYFSQGSNNGEGSKRNKLLIFMVDSNPRDASTKVEILKHVIEQNEEKTNNTVVIQAYSFGQNINQTTMLFLDQLADQTEFVTSSGIHKRGKHIHVQSQVDVRTQLSSYYNTFAESGSVHPIISPPYEDFSGLGTVISLCLPVHDNNDTLKGVTCIDAKVLDIFYNITYFKKGKDAYAFLIDDSGRSIIHPSMLPPTKERTLFLHISTLEKEATEQGIIGSMLRGENGSQSLYVEMRKFGGEAYGQYQDTHFVQATYFWRRIPHTNYSICVVLTGDDYHMNVKVKKEYMFEDNMYRHDRTLEIKPDQPQCLHMGKRCTKEGTTVMFIGVAQQRLRYTTTLRDEQSTNLRYFKGKPEDQNDDFKEDTKEWVYLSAHIDTIWRAPPAAKFDTKLYWRHLALESGINRVYPGTRFDEKYLPNKMPWYKEALATPTRLVLTRNCTLTANDVIMSKAINIGSPSEKPVGVLAGEFRAFYFNNLLREIYPSCTEEENRCFLMDGKGFVLTHKMLDPKSSQVHLLDMEPAIAEYLIQEGHMQTRSCSDFDTFKRKQTWVVSMKSFSIIHSSFEIHTVWETNTYVGIAWGGREGMHSGRECGAPGVSLPSCTYDLPFDHCNNTLPRDKLRKYDLTCELTRPPLIVFPFPREAAIVSNSTPACFEPDCSHHSDESDCLQYIGCGWCQESGKTSQDKVCIPKEQCGKPLFDPTRLIKIILPIVLIIIIAIIIMAIIIMIRRKNCCCYKRPVSYSNNNIKPKRDSTEKGRTNRYATRRGEVPATNGIEQQQHRPPAPTPQPSLGNVNQAFEHDQGNPQQQIYRRQISDVAAHGEATVRAPITTPGEGTRGEGDNKSKPDLLPKPQNPRKINHGPAPPIPIGGTGNTAVPSPPNSPSVHQPSVHQPSVHQPSEHMPSHSHMLYENGEAVRLAEMRNGTYQDRNTKGLSWRVVENESIPDEDYTTIDEVEAQNSIIPSASASFSPSTSASASVPDSGFLSNKRDADSTALKRRY